MARIVITGDRVDAGLTDSIIAAFRTLGCTVDLLPFGPHSPDWLAAAAFRAPVLGSGFRRGLRRRIDVLSATGPADLVLVMKGTLLSPRLVDRLRARLSAPVVCWNPDSPFDGDISNRGAGIPQVIGAYDAYVTWADDVAERLSTIASRVLVIPFAWDPGLLSPTPGAGVAAGRVVFIGTGTRERCAWLQSLTHLHPMVFGSRWPDMQGIDVRPPALGAEFSRIVGEAKWNVNLLRPQNRNSHNMRTFELVGAGGNQAAPLTADHRRFLGSDNRTALFRTREELEVILRSHPEQRRPRSPRVLEGHTYVDRTRQLLSELHIL